MREYVFSVHAKAWPDPYDAARYKFGWRPSSGLQQLKEFITRCALSPAILEGGVRLGKNFVKADFCVLDFDEHAMTLEEAVRTFCDMKHVIATTKSHTPKVHSFRVVIPFDKTLDQPSYQASIRQVMDRYPVVDISCKDAPRFFYHCNKIISYQDEGYEMDSVHAEISHTPPRGSFVSPYKGSRTFPPWARAALEEPQKPGARYTTCWRIAKDLLVSGFTRDEVLSILQGSPVAPGYQDSQYIKAVSDAEIALAKDSLTNDIEGVFE
jgi:hypothetical protein